MSPIIDIILARLVIYYHKMNEKDFFDYISDDAIKHLYKNKDFPLVSWSFADIGMGKLRSNNINSEHLIDSQTNNPIIMSELVKQKAFVKQKLGIR